MKKVNCLLPIAICLLLLAGCKDSKESTSVSQSGGPTGAAASRQYRNELLTYAVNNLNRLEEFDSPDVLQKVLWRLQEENENPETSDQSDTLLAAWPEPEMLRQIVDRLNQWIRTQPSTTDWQLDPMVASLPEPLAALPQVKNLYQMEFSRYDGYALQQVVWLRDVGLWARGDALNDLIRAQSLFDWTIRNIQLEPDSDQRIPLFPWETLLFGRGTATERAWLFILLARQLDIDAAMLGLEEGSGRRVALAQPVARGAGDKSDIQNLKSEIPNPQSPIPNP